MPSKLSNRPVDHSRFESEVKRAMRDLPDWVRDALDNIAIQIVDEADETMDVESEGLLGLYVGLPLPERGADYAGVLPDVIYIFRKPHLELNLSPAELGREIEKTLVHEIAHYFGFDDDRLEGLGY